MRHAWITILGAWLLAVWLCYCERSIGADLGRIDRAIAKLPAFTSETQAYCLLVFGPDARTHVWLVRDGDVLYVDRNGNGDLTESQERVAAYAETSQPEKGVLQFRVGEVADVQALHKDLQVAWFDLSYLREIDSDVRQALVQDSNLRGCSIAIDVEIPNQRGSGIGGRISQSAVIKDHRGLLKFAARPSDAPIIHFGGPLEVTLAAREQWRVGRTQEVYLVVGTPGIGAGTTANVAYDKLIPPAIAPVLQASFPPGAPGEAEVIKSYELPRRCCGANLYGDIAIPESSGVGTAKVEISLESWPGVFVSPTRHEIEVGARIPGPILEPVSSRLTTKLVHENPNAFIGSLEFSPDGKRLVAGTYPEGIINVWDLASGKRLTSIDAGNGLRATADYFAFSPDWKTLFAWQEGRGAFEKLEREGKTINRVQYNSVIRSWNVDSGRPLRTFQHSPPHGIRMMFMAPNGKYFLTLDEIPGEFDASRPRGLSLWDTATGKYREVAKGDTNPGAISSDSRLVAVSMPVPHEDSYTESIRIVAAPEWEEQRKIQIDGKLISASPSAFVADNRILVGVVRNYNQVNDWRNFEDALKFWDVASGMELFTVSAQERNQGFAYVNASSDGQTVVATTYNRLTGKPERLVIVNVSTKMAKFVDVGARHLMQPLFHPAGKWVAVTTAPIVPIAQLRTAAAEDFPQPYLALIDLASGEILESLVLPQGSTGSAFSPDGGMLATAGKGEVLFWEFHSPLAANRAAKFDR